jgi:UDP:flavonoid glycosyltransferase YjiC (YdhE family)
VANILFAWELGSNLGHLMSILPIAEELQRRGHSVTLAVKDLARFAQIDSHPLLTVVQSPLFFPRAEMLRESMGYCDILAISGYLTETSLLPLLRAWRELLALLDVDVVVAQHAPTALLAARSAGRPAVAIGSGFMCPPAMVPLPGFLPLTAVQRAELSHTETQILAACNKALEKFSATPLPNLANLFLDAETLLCIYPELEHYDMRDNVEYIGPLYADAAAAPIEFPRKYKKNILIYLNNFKCWNNLRAACAALEANVLCAAVGLPKHEVERACTANMTVVDYPIPLSSLYQYCDLVVCHGGPGTVAGALAAGRPLLLLPTQKEQLILSNRIAERGYGQFLTLDAGAAQLQQAMTCLLSDAFKKTAIEQYAVKYRDITMADRIGYIADKIAAVVLRAIA